MPKILEIITEPDKIYTGSVFRLKIKAELRVTCKQVKDANLKCSKAKQYKCHEYMIGGTK